MTQTTTPEATEAVETEQAQPETTEVTETSPAEKQDGPDERALIEAGQKILERRKALGLSRANLCVLTGLTGAKLWRCEDGRGKPEELEAIDKALTEVEKNGLPEGMKAKKAKATVKTVSWEEHEKLVIRLQMITGLVDAAVEAKTRKDANEFLAEIKRIASGEIAEQAAEEATDEQPQDAQ